MKHSRQEKRRRIELFKRFVASNPPKMPAKFTHKEYKRVIAYAKIAFITGYNTGENDVCRGREVVIFDRGLNLPFKGLGK